MLMGSPGARKSTAIKNAARLLKKVGGIVFAADKTSKEKMLVDMAAHAMELTGSSLDDPLDKLQINWGAPDDNSEVTTPLLIAADEFNDFIGTSNHEFISLLGNLWDYNGVFTYRTKSGTEVFIPNPNLCILGGNTPTNFNSAFPPETLGQGFFSRLMLIYGEPSGRKIAWPVPPTPEATASIVGNMARIQSLAGEMQVSRESAKLLSDIYHTWKRPEDTRLVSYGERRHTHLLKMCMIHAASRLSMDICVEDIVMANTVLSFAEHYMPTAFGEFGRGRNSEITQKILTYIENANRPVGGEELFAAMSNDLTDSREIGTIFANLVGAQKLILVKDQGFLLKKRILEIPKSTDQVDYRLLTLEEMKGLKL